MDDPLTAAIERWTDPVAREVVTDLFARLRAVEAERDALRATARKMLDADASGCVCGESQIAWKRWLDARAVLCRLLDGGTP